MGPLIARRPDPEGNHSDGSEADQSQRRRRRRYPRCDGVGSFTAAAKIIFQPRAPPTPPLEPPGPPPVQRAHCMTLIAASRKQSSLRFIFFFYAQLFLQIHDGGGAFYTIRTSDRVAPPTTLKKNGGSLGSLLAVP